jgi:predicted TIM-barrel fold metal-dependent hydrolase
VVSDELILPWLERLREELPGLDLFDVHTHIGGNDPDGYRCSPRELLDALELAGARAVVFPMHEPDGYAAANDRVLDEAAGSGGRLVAFCRVDPAAGPVQEAERCLNAGARGIKLHPRAEGFTLDHPGVAEIAALAHERAVPVLVHAGRGIPALGRNAVELCDRFPRARLILAHAGICDLAWIWRASSDRPNLFFDTAWWSPSDLLALFALVPPGQILVGSDAPYGTPAFGATMAIRYALQAGLAEEQVRAVAGGQLDRILGGRDALALGPPPGEGSLSADPLLDRVYGYLMTALGQMFRGEEPSEPLALATLACEVGDDAPQAEVCSSILAVIDERAEYARAGGVARPGLTPGIHLVVLAAGIARTPDVPLPPDPVPVDVGERAAR